MAGVRRPFALRLKRMADAVLGFIAVGALKAIRLVDVDIMSNFAGEDILRGAWENLGRAGAEFAHIDRLWDYRAADRQDRRIMDSADSEQIALRLRDDGKPALIFSAHLANWELAAVAATHFGLDTTVLYRRPNLSAVSDAVVALRAGCMGTLIPTGLDAPVKLAAALQRGSHVAMLVDQYTVQGVDVTFFGRRTKANPLIARLARHVDCPIHGICVVRHPGNRFRLEMTEAITPPRDAEGKVDVQGTMQVITDVVEGWVRKHPDQWLWLHRRWRDE
jgi:KDO2-lipid IV(A) lauroyltransferase